MRHRTDPAAYREHRAMVAARAMLARRADRAATAQLRQLARPGSPADARALAAELAQVVTL